VRIVGDKRWAAAALACFVAMSLAATLFPRRFKLIQQVPGADKAGHLIVMTLLALVLVVALAGATWRGRRIGTGLCVAGTLLLVTIDEVSQLAIPGRTFSWLDLAYSWAGVLLGGAVGGLWLRGRTSRPVADDAG
jgi:polysaccharide biosynthesis protein VpsQ